MEGSAALRVVLALRREAGVDVDPRLSLRRVSPGVEHARPRRPRRDAPRPVGSAKGAPDPQGDEGSEGPTVGLRAAQRPPRWARRPPVEKADELGSVRPKESKRHFPGQTATRHPRFPFPLPPSALGISHRLPPPGVFVNKEDEEGPTGDRPGPEVPPPSDPSKGPGGSARLRALGTTTGALHP